MHEGSMWACALTMIVVGVVLPAVRLVRDWSSSRLQERGLLVVVDSQRVRNLKSKTGSGLYVVRDSNPVGQGVRPRVRTRGPEAPTSRTSSRNKPNPEPLEGRRS